MMIHHKRKEELQYHLSQKAEMRFYTSLCIWLVDRKYPTYFQIYLASICFILPLQISWTVLQYLNDYEAS